MFCGQLEARFPGKLILYISRPGCRLAKPYKSRLFSCLTVHSRPPFPFTFCFLPPVNSGGAVGTVFRPVGFWDEHAAADRTAFQVPAPVNLRFQCPSKRQDRPAEPLTADRERNDLRAGAGIAIVKGDTIPAVVIAALPPDKGVRLFPLCQSGRACRLTCAPTAASVYMGFLSCVPSVYFPLPFSPKGFPALARSPDFGTSWCC